MTANAASTRIAGEAELWHRRFNHLGFENLKRAVKMVDGMPSTVADAKRLAGTVCVPCVDGKMAQAPHPRSSTKTTKCELVHTDVCGPLTESLGGSSYFVTVLEDSTGFITATPIKTKAMAPDVVNTLIKQLETLGKQLSMPVFSLGDQVSPVEIAKQAIAKAKEDHNDYVLIDTAGRLHVDENLMDELKQIKELSKPDEIFLVVDAMTGQDAVNVAQSFNEQLGLTGVVLTKLDGDTRGGAALSIRAVTNTPIKFVGLGEKLDALEAFHPERMASRILGMGDVLTLIEKAQANVDEEKAKELEKKMRTASFTLDDFLDQLGQVKKMGPLDEILKMMPGANKIKGMNNLQIDEKQISHVEAIIQSMTAHEKTHPEVINANRRKRIAKGSGTSIQEVNRLLKQFEDMKKMMKQMTNMQQKGKKKGGFKMPFNPF